MSLFKHNFPILDYDTEQKASIMPVRKNSKYRCKGIAGKLLNMVVADMKIKGISPIYLVTDHVGFYEKYGWEFLCLVQGDDEPDMTRIYVHR